MSNEIIQIIPYDPNNMLNNVHTQEIIELLKLFKRVDSLKNNLEFIASIINIESYLDSNLFSNKFYQKIDMTEKDLRSLINRIVSKYFNNEIGIVYEKNEFWIEKAIWKFISKEKNIIKRIDSIKLLSALNKRNICVKNILIYPRLVKEFDSILFKFLIANNDDLIAIVIDSYEIKKKYIINEEKIKLPANLNINTKNGIMNLNKAFKQYISDSNENDASRMSALNAISNPSKLIVDKTISFAAKSKAQEISKSIKWSNLPIKNTVIFHDIDQLCLIENGNLIYNKKWLKDNTDFKTQFIYNFTHLFGFMYDGIFNLGLSNNQLAFSNVYLEFNGDYENNLALTPFYIHLDIIKKYNDFLMCHEESIESLINHFYNVYITKEFKLDDFMVEISTDNIPFKFKVKDLLSNLDLTVQKIENYQKNGKLDIDFVYFDDTLTEYSNIESKLSIKNIYPSELKENVSPYLFLNYSSNYIKSNEDYVSVYTAVKSNELYYHNLSEIEVRKINEFIAMNVLVLNNDLIQFKSETRAKIYNKLYNYSEVSVTSLQKNEIEVVIQDIKAGYMISDNNFFSEREVNFLNYLLNEKSYSRGPKIRNKYVHKGSLKNKSSDFEHEYYYNILLMIFVKITLKFNIELCKS